MLPKQQQLLQQYNSKGKTRTRLVIDEREKACVRVNGKKVINFSSNDYFNLSTHPKIKKAFLDGVSQYGLGSGSSQLISGYFKSHQVLEETFAEYFGFERALLFNSGYHANLSILTALGDRNSIYIADKYSHASLIDGMQLSAGKMRRFRHQDFAHAETLLQKNSAASLFFVTESVFSMEGDISDIAKFRALAQKYQAFTIVDHAHGIGFVDDIVNIDCLSIPLGKAFGSMGAIVLGNDTVIESLLQFGRTFCYTTALPPAISMATLASLKILRAENFHLEKLKSLIRFFNKQAKERGLTLVSDAETPIKCILMHDNQSA
ncbi:MAG TPA: 8-amino-7-oxononanoate synthase, partial [Gammaproteobacteria bacterium]|nr:8-amino-7-oxononanoate synthase [Gammaproteobacteria bacterium]